MKKLIRIAFVLMCMLMVFATGCSQQPMAYETIHKAASTGNLANVKMHLKNGANVNARDKSNQTPLMLAAFAGKLDVAKLLVDKNADVNAKDNKGITASIFAALKFHPEIIEFLRQHGAK